MKNGSTKIDLTDLDSFVESNNLNTGFIKADVEGAGLKSLQGMQQVIKKDRPVLALAIYHTPVELFDMKPLLDGIVKDLNYVITIEQHFPFVQANFDLVLFAYPRELM